MPIVLYRVDERLIHGQVTVAWGGHLQPDRYVVVDDELAGSEWERELHRLGVPPGADAVFVSVGDARGALDRWQADEDQSVILLTRDLDSMLRLARGGGLRGREVNLGGIHHAAGRSEVLPYVFLDDADRERIRELARGGVDVVARDLPGSTRAGTDRLLR